MTMTVRWNERQTWALELTWATVWGAKNQTTDGLRGDTTDEQTKALTNLQVVYWCVFTCFKFASTLNMLLCLLFCFVPLIHSSSVFPRIHFSPVCEFLVIPCNYSHCENGSFEILSLQCLCGCVCVGVCVCCLLSVCVGCVCAFGVCERWDLCWSVTVPWNIAKYMLGVENHSARLWGWDRRKDRRCGWKKGERELVLVVTVKCGKEWDMTRWWQLFYGHKDVHSFDLEPRVFAWLSVIMLCNSVRAVLVCVLFTPPVGWLEVFLQVSETCPNSEKKLTNRKGWKNAENSNWSSSNGFGHMLTTLTKLFACWPAILTKMFASFPATVCRTSNLFSGQRRSRILRRPQIVVLFAVLFVDCEEYLCILVGFLPSVRHAIVCILLSLEQSRVVDWVVAEFLLEHLP